MEPQKLEKDPIKGFGLNEHSLEEHGTTEAKPSERKNSEEGSSGEPTGAEKTTLNTSGVQEGLDEKSNSERRSA